MTDFIKQRREDKALSLRPYLFNIFTENIIDYISKENQHEPVIVMTAIQELLFADDLAFSSFTFNDLQKAVNQVTKYRREWNLKCNLNETKILVFKK